MEVRDLRDIFISFLGTGKYDKKRELLNGYIDYTIKAKTPIMVGSRKIDKDNRQAEFFRNPEGNMPFLPILS